MVLNIVYRAFIFQSEFWGKTGIVRIDSEGERTDFELEIKQIRPDADWGTVETVGSWSTRGGLMWRGERSGIEEGKL